MTKEIIKQALKNISIIHNTRQKELDIYWKTAARNEVNNLPEGISKKGATKELNALIKSFENEIEEDMKLDNETMEHFIEFLIDHYESNTREDILKLFDPLNNISKLTNIIPGQYFTWDDMEHITVNVVYNIFRDIQILKKHKKRFFENGREKHKAINNLNKSIEVAIRFNNQLLVQELKTMIEQIEEENLITEEIIYKSCFYGLYNSLLQEFSKTKSVELANELLEEFFPECGKRYKPSKNIDQKDFFEQGFDHPRSFIYYKS